MPQTEQYRRLGKFELHALIGEGAMGAVWKAYDTVLRRYIALKLLSAHFGKTHGARERFLREARAAGALQHPNIVTVYDLGEAEGQLFIAMELVDGRDLSELISSSEPLALERKLDIVIELLQGLAYAHERGVVHRDIKPSNVRVASDARVKIMDFGIARLQSAERTGSGAIIGTPTYMAPEQVTNGAITAATDLFAVGCTLYELLSYRKPFEGETVHGVLYQVLTTDPRPLRTMAPSIPASLERVVTKAMNKVPEDRYESARQMQQALLGIRAALSGASQTTEQLSPRWTAIPAPVLRLVTHAPMKWRVAVLTALAAVAGALWYSSRTSAPPAPTGLAAPATAIAGPQPSPVPAGASVEQLIAAPLPAGLNPALVALRDSALAAREHARRQGAAKNNVPSLVLAETVLGTAEQALRAGATARASNAYLSAVTEYKKAGDAAEKLRQEAERAIARATPVVRGLATRPEASRAGSSLARAESLYREMDYALAKLAAMDAEEVGVAAGVAPASPQPADPRAAIEVLLQDLARAIASERVANLGVLYPAMTANERKNWERFFKSAAQLSVKYDVKRLSVRGKSASADVDATYVFVPRGGGVRREDRRRHAMQFTKSANGWRLASVKDLGS